MTLTGFFFIAAMFCIAGVAISLFIGIFTMTQGEQKDREKSNKMMRMRILFQGLALLFLALAWLAK